MKIHPNTKHRKWSLNLKIGLTTKFLSTLMQRKRKSCESHTRFFFKFYFKSYKLKSVKSHINTVKFAAQYIYRKLYLWYYSY